MQVIFKRNKIYPQDYLEGNKAFAKLFLKNFVEFYFSTGSIYCTTNKFQYIVLENV